MNDQYGTLFEVNAEGIATLTLNEPARLNPITTAIQQGTLAALQRVRDDTTIRALILTGSGKAFCVGADLDQLAAWSQSAQGADSKSRGDQVGDMMQQAANPIIQGLHELPVPVVCAINGPAVGGGFGFALAGDIVIAAQSAYFYLPFVSALGLVPDGGFYSVNSIADDGWSFISNDSSTCGFWRLGIGRVSISQLFQAQGIDLTGKRLVADTLMSGDGRVFVGTFLDDAGQRFAFRATVQPPCRSDLDADGDTDSDDIIRFFDAYGRGSIDIDLDVDTDSDDVVAFFSDWDSGC